MPVLMRLWFAVLLLSACGLDMASAQAVQQGITPQGWRYEQGPGQVERYVCEKPDCGRDALVSYQLQPVRSGYTLKAFRREKTESYTALGQNLLAGGPLKIGVAASRRLGPTPLMSIDVAGTLRNGQPHIRVSGYLLGRNQTVSLISSAADRASARKNFDLFANALAVQEASGTLK
jgi:hypothetical protein